MLQRQIIFFSFIKTSKDKNLIFEFEAAAADSWSNIFRIDNSDFSKKYGFFHLISIFSLRDVNFIHNLRFIRLIHHFIQNGFKKVELDRPKNNQIILSFMKIPLTFHTNRILFLKISIRILKYDRNNSTLFLLNNLLLLFIATSNI
jgi:hypothetical protein